jgi:two-component system, OmpR family, sensor kinase
MSLRVRLGLVFALGTALLIGAVGLAFLVQLHRSLDATLDAGLRGRADAIAGELVTDGPRAVRVTGDEQPVQVLDPDGRVLVSSRKFAAAPVLDPAGRQEARTRAAAGRAPDAFTVGEEGDRTRFVAQWLADPGVFLLVGGTTEIVDAADEHLDRGFLFLGPPAVLVAGVGAWWLAGAALRPVERLRRQTADLSVRDDGTSLAVPATRDEIAALATTMNDLVGRLRAALAHERSFVADAGHELRTPLATLRAELELAARPGRTAAELHDAVVGAGVETDRLIRLAEDLLLLAHAEEGRPAVRRGPTDLVEVAVAATRGAEVLGRARHVTVALDAPTTAEVCGDPDQLRRAADNVLSNAVRHSPDGGTVEVGVDAVEHGERVRLRVRDHGAGFPPDFLPHAFERFRRADTARARSGGGTGLGLAIVEAIVRAHDGTVRAADHEQGGAVVEIELPGRSHETYTEPG